MPQQRTLSSFFANSTQSSSAEIGGDKENQVFDKRAAARQKRRKHFEQLEAQADNAPADLACGTHRATKTATSAKITSLPSTATKPSAQTKQNEGSVLEKSWLVVKKSIIKAGPDLKSNRVGIVKAGTVVVELDKSGENRIRTKDGWMSIISSAGNILLSRDLLAQPVAIPKPPLSATPTTACDTATAGNGLDCELLKRKETTRKVEIPFSGCAVRLNHSEMTSTASSAASLHRHTVVADFHVGPNRASMSISICEISELQPELLRILLTATKDGQREEVLCITTSRGIFVRDEDGTVGPSAAPNPLCDSEAEELVQRHAGSNADAVGNFLALAGLSNACPRGWSKQKKRFMEAFGVTAAEGPASTTQKRKLRNMASRTTAADINEGSVAVITASDQKNAHVVDPERTDTLSATDRGDSTAYMLENLSSFGSKVTSARQLLLLGDIWNDAILLIQQHHCHDKHPAGNLGLGIGPLQMHWWVSEFFWLRSEQRRREQRHGGQCVSHDEAISAALLEARDCRRWALSERGIHYRRKFALYQRRRGPKPRWPSAWPLPQWYPPEVESVAT